MNYNSSSRNDFEYRVQNCEYGVEQLGFDEDAVFADYDEETNGEVDAIVLTNIEDNIESVRHFLEEDWDKDHDLVVPKVT